MRGIGYDAIDAHVVHHTHCLERVKELAIKYRSAGSLTENILIQCFDTIIEDIAKADLMFGEFLDEKGLREGSDYLGQAHTIR